MISRFLSSVCILLALGGNVPTSLLLIKHSETQSRVLFFLFFYHVRARKHRVVTDWGCRILRARTQQETIHLCLQIERSHWFHFSEGRSYLGWKMDIPCCLALSRAFLLVSLAMMHREKHCHWTSHQRTVPQLIAGAALSRFWPHMAACICQHVQWKQSHFHCSYNDILIDRCYLLAGFHSSFSLSALISPPPWLTPSAPVSSRVKEKKHHVLSVWMMQLFTADKKDDY